MPVPTQCTNCAGGMPQPPQQLNPEQLRKMMAAREKAQEVNKAFMKETQPLQKKSVKLFKAMKRCKNCKESKYKFVPCEKHLQELKDLTEEMNQLKMYYGLKQQFDRLK